MTRFGPSLIALSTISDLCLCMLPMILKLGGGGGGGGFRVGYLIKLI